MKAITLNDFFDSVLHKEESAYRRELKDKQKISSYKTLKNNINPGEIVVIASRPGEGKTNFLFNLLIDQVIEKEEKVLLLSVRNNPETNFIQLINIAEQKEYTKRTFLDNVILNNKQVYSKYEITNFIGDALSHNHDIRAIYIDDIHRLSIFSQLYPNEEIFQEPMVDSSYCYDLGILFNILTTIAAKYSIPIFLTTEIKNSSVQRGRLSKPKFEDLLINRIEYIADKVLFLFRPTYHGLTEDENRNSTLGLFEVKIAKNKNGEADKIIELRARDMIVEDFENDYKKSSFI